ncbi:MAG: DUF5671 domain-containing protein, partial [Candidatus Paceibacterota bacterium]
LTYNILNGILFFMETQHSNRGNQSRLHIGFFFLSLGFLVTLITSVVSFLNLAFSTLDKQFPDVLNAVYAYGYSSYDYEGMRTALSTLIIFFPVLLIVAYFWNKQASMVLGSIDAQIKKWLTYIVLFLAAVVVAVDLVTLVRYFVAGEITNRFIYKVLITFVVALYVGGYFILQLLDKKKVYGMKTGVVSAVDSSILVIALIVFSFSVMGSPNTQRLLRLDERRIQDLQNIQYQVINYWQQKEKLPALLSDVATPISGYVVPVDPEFHKGFTYEYAVKDKLSFELCATFALPIKKGWSESRGGGMPIYMDNNVSTPLVVGGVNESWAHEAGRACFTRTIDPEIYPPFQKPELR